MLWNLKKNGHPLGSERVSGFNKIHPPPFEISINAYISIYIPTNMMDFKKKWPPSRTERVLVYNKIYPPPRTEISIMHTF